MPRFAANLTMLFTEVPFLDRFAKAAQCGFTAVEYLFPYDYAAKELAAQLHTHRLTQALFNLPPGDWEKGERGIACLPDREEEYLQGVTRAISYAQALGNSCVHSMAGLIPNNLPYDVTEATYLSNIATAAKMVAEHGLTLCIEPINHRSMPGYFLHRQGQAAEYIAGLSAQGIHNVRLQFDVFHVQMEEGCVSLKMREFFPITGHYQIASVPERHEPDRGEINYTTIFTLMDELGYEGFVGCEYNPAGDTAAGLSWFAPYTQQRAKE